MFNPMVCHYIMFMIISENSQPLYQPTIIIFPRCGLLHPHIIFSWSLSIFHCEPFSEIVHQSSPVGQSGALDRTEGALSLLHDSRFSAWKICSKCEVFQDEKASQPEGPRSSALADSLLAHNHSFCYPLPPPPSASLWLAAQPASG